MTVFFTAHEKVILNGPGLRDISNTIKEKFLLKTISQISSQQVNSIIIRGIYCI